MSRRNGSAGAAQGGGEGEIDLTPMLDVVFIMLIFFIVTSSFIKEPGVEITKTEALSTSACERGTIIFAVTALGDIYYDKKEISIDSARRLAEAAKKESPKANFVIQADVDSPTSVVDKLYTILKPVMEGVPLCASTEEAG